MKTKRSILIVDDSPLIIERLSELLKELDHIDIIVNAGNYEDAIEMLTTKNIDTVLLDIHLPGKNGIALLKYIKAIYPDIKVIMLSNQATGFYRSICKNAGASYFIDKSKEFESIPTIISSLDQRF